MSNCSEQTNQMSQRLDRIRDQLLTELTENRDSQRVRSDEVYKFASENLQTLTKQVSFVREDLSASITQVREELQGGMNLEADSLKTFVMQTTTRASAHRDTLQEKYDEKLEKIKDVCAKYFEKYEKVLGEQGSQVRGMERRMEEWINTLLKPQELNQARLFTLDTRIREGEMNRGQDQQYFKDLFKKLIFAIEQHMSNEHKQP